MLRAFACGINMLRPLNQDGRRDRYSDLLNTSAVATASPQARPDTTEAVDQTFLIRGCHVD